MTELHATASASYPSARLADAMVTALIHHDPDTRERAEARMRRWQDVIDGMSAGTLTVGSRTPVDGLPPWVTLDVIQGGFATGKPLASGPLLDHELELAHRVGIIPARRALFAYHLTERGLAELHALLASGDYTIEHPEEAVLPTLAWLLAAGDHSVAIELLDQVEPFVDRLRFAPRPGRDTDPELVWRYTAGDAAARLAARRPNRRVAAMREALTVWNPFADDLLAHWLDPQSGIHDPVDGHPAGHHPDWMDRSRALLARYTTLALNHTLCRKPHRAGSNIAVLHDALFDVVSGRGLTPRTLRFIHRVIADMIARRGRPGSDEHTRLRETQRRQAAHPDHHEIAQVLLERLATLPHDQGIVDVVATLRPIAQHEATDTLPAGTPVPDSVGAVLWQAQASSIGRLIARKVVPSAEVLATLIPRLTATAITDRYPDPTLATLMAKNYLAFSRRRSLLLLNLEHQVRLSELPWVRAVDAYIRADNPAGPLDPALATLATVAELALTHFPGTILPNKLIKELAVLRDAASADLPLVEELAVDIFTGTFSVKFARAAQIAADLLRGSLYERYYGIDYRRLRIALDAEAPVKRYSTHVSPVFAELCETRVPPLRGHRSYTAANGTVIEQAQILTTHNLAVLVAKLRVAPDHGWIGAAEVAFDHVIDLVRRVHRNPRPLPTIKDAAYAWRQVVFCLSLCDNQDRRGFLDSAEIRLARYPVHLAGRLAPVVDGLRWVLHGGSFTDPDATGRRFLGWSTNRHWMAADPSAADPRT